MSTTAGLGSGDYVAVNGAAVFAALCGLASALALMSELLLVIPLVGIIASIMALRQIQSSNGTQTGKGLVALGLLGALGFGGFVLVRWATEGIRTAEDRQAIHRLVLNFGAKANSGDVAGAYALFSPRFAGVIDQTKFAERFKVLQDFFGKVSGAEWNGLVEFQNTEDNTGDRFGWTTVQVNFQKPTGEKNQLKDTAVLRKSGGQWRIEAMKEIFPPPAPPQGQSPGGPRG
jgi:hypothetical protein